MESKLGEWSVIDIETTGIDPMNDSIIDVGFLHFDGVKLVKKYSSLVRFEGKLSHFIAKLTGINNKSLKVAPRIEEVKVEIQTLFSLTLLAHNASFEDMFLKEIFNEVAKPKNGAGPQYVDSLYYLSLLFPHFSSLNLERFIIEFQIADKEVHRGLEDSVDLLKVMLIATYIIRQDKELYHSKEFAFKDHHLDDHWFYHFFTLSLDELDQLGNQIDFDLKKHLDIYTHAEALKKNPTLKDQFDNGPARIDLYGDNIFSGGTLKDIYTQIKTESEHSAFSYRESQEKLSLKVGQSFKNNVHSLIQAPTGTGKTFGYLLPLALFCIQQKKQVLVATGTKALQQQAMQSDVPQLMNFLNITDEHLKVRQLIGSNNHLCELNYRQILDEKWKDLFIDKTDFHFQFLNMYFDLVFYHNSICTPGEEIIAGSLPYVLKKKIDDMATFENDIRVDYRSCLSGQCPYKKGCAYLKGLREAKDADIIIGNHSLMFSWTKAFARPQYIVLDEAHKIEHEATSAFTLSVSVSSLEHFVNSLAQMQGIGALFYLLHEIAENEGEYDEVIDYLKKETTDVHDILKEHLIELAANVEIYFKKMTRYTEQYWNELPLLKGGGQDSLALIINNSLESIYYGLSKLVKDLTPWSLKFDSDVDYAENSKKAISRFEKFFSTLSEFSESLSGILELPNKMPDYVASLKFHAKEGILFESSPIDIGQKLHDNLLSVSSSVVYVSATLGNETGNLGAKGIEWATGYSYLPPDKRFKHGEFLPGVFDYANKALVYLCDDTPSLFSADFVPSVFETLINIIKQLKGGALLLFSARTRFEIARELLIENFDGEIPLFIQGMGNDIVSEFKKEGRGVLLGMESMGEGINLPGECLQFIFIDKIPDLRLNLVTNKRRDFYEQALGNEFLDYYLSHRTRALHQKLGRLLRTENDFGGIIIVDSRIKKWKGRTMQKVLELMSPYQIKRASLSEAEKGVLSFVNTH